MRAGTALQTRFRIGSQQFAIRSRDGESTSDQSRRRSVTTLIIAVTLTAGGCDRAIDESKNRISESTN